jgi:hypothetical protein
MSARMNAGRRAKMTDEEDERRALPESERQR